MSPHFRLLLRFGNGVVGSFGGVFIEVFSPNSVSSVTRSSDLRQNRMPRPLLLDSRYDPESSMTPWTTFFFRNWATSCQPSIRLTNSSSLILASGSETASDGAEAGVGAVNVGEENVCLMAVWNAIRLARSPRPRQRSPPCHGSSQSYL